MEKVGFLKRGDVLRLGVDSPVSQLLVVTVENNGDIPWEQAYMDARQGTKRVLDVTVDAQGKIHLQPAHNDSNSDPAMDQMLQPTKPVQPEATDGGSPSEDSQDCVIVDP
jgi:hypothetical protein